MNFRTYIVAVTVPVTLFVALAANVPAGVQPGDGFENGDAQRGEMIYESRCTACHSLDANRVGPKHRQVFGRRAGSVEGYAYSPALRQSEIVWDAEALERWLADPEALIPGQRMIVRVADPADRADIIAYVKNASKRTNRLGRQGIEHAADPDRSRDGM